MQGKVSVANAPHSVADAPHHQYRHAPGRQDAGQGKLVKSSTSL